MMIEQQNLLFRNLYTRIVRYPAYVTAIDSIDMCRREVRESGMSSGMALLGPGGVGKTTILKSYAEANPPLKVPGGIIKPVVRASILSSNSPSSTLCEIIEAISPIHAVGIGKGIAKHERRLATAMELSGTEVLLIDEAHNFLGYANKSAVRSVSSALKNLMNKLTFSLVISGTEEAIGLITGDSQMPSRIPLIIQLRPFGIESVDDLNEFRGVLAALEKSIGMSQVSRLYEREMAQRIYYACDGNFRLLSKLLHKAISIAKRENTESLSREVMRRAFISLVGPGTKDASNPFSEAFVPRRIINQGEPLAYQARL